MKLKDFIENLNKFVKDDPKCLEFDVITSEDDEGNGYSLVYYTPSKGMFDGEDFQTEREDYEIEEDDFNALCIN